MIDMIPKELPDLIHDGENHVVEFKKSTANITKDVYERVCAFFNRDEGHVFLGIHDKGVIPGIQPDCIEQMKEDSVTAVNVRRRAHMELNHYRLKPAGSV